LENRCLLSAGAVDLAFGIGGSASVDFAVNDSLQAVAIDPAGRIVVAGHPPGGAQLDDMALTLQRYARM
jgi:hypothetical protein